MYADDTLLIGTDSDVLQTFMDSIAAAGKQYGLSFNWKKLELLRVRTSAKILTETGEQLKTKDSMIYLGSLLSADGKIASELARRLGAAQSEFSSLARVWKHSSLSRPKKIRIFDACICSKLSYGLFSAILRKADERRIDGFQTRCLRRILEIPHAYHNRISNARVLQIVKETPLSDKIGKQQCKRLENSNATI